jgi:hypothetical protein
MTTLQSTTIAAAAVPSRLALVRNKQRGTAVTEAAVFIPLFAILFTGMGFVAHLYVNKLNVMRFARGYAWQSAVANCEGQPPPRDPADKGDANGKAGGGGPTTASGTEPLDPSGTNGTADANNDADINSLSQDSPSLSKSGANTSSTSNRSVKYSSANWSPAAKVESTSKMMCNEPRSKTGLVAVIKRAVGLAKL